MAATVRVLAPSEITALHDRLLALAIAAKGTWGYDAAFMRRFAQEMDAELAGLAETVDRPGGREPCVLLAEDGAELVGYAVLRDGGDHALLDDLWVDPERQGRGAGRALWDRACDLARSWGRSRLELEADPNAEAFYARMGARTVGHRASTYVAGRKLPLMQVELG